MDDMPVYSKEGVGYSLGHCGAGVSFSSQAAYRLAQSIAGEALPNLPLYQQALPKFPYPSNTPWAMGLLSLWLVKRPLWLTVHFALYVALSINRRLRQCLFWFRPMAQF
ncbi:hypothetical protein PEC18_34855 [Paucibacter sp. O1-1]|nr:hypothetical protein [Paucibacter sp. O1-1]MDA3830860.1 hypothetical protein [Paucibacter sp. O1-1]